MNVKAVSLTLAFASAIWIAVPTRAVQDTPRGQSGDSSSAADNPKTRPKQEASDEEPVHRRAPANKQLRGSATATPGNRLQQIPKREAAPDSGAETPRSVLGEPGRAAREAFAQSEVLNGSALPTRPPRIAPGRGLTANNPHHRSPNPAVVDGSMNPNTRNTGAINGARIVRKP